MVVLGGVGRCRFSCRGHDRYLAGTRHGSSGRVQHWLWVSTADGRQDEYLASAQYVRLCRNAIEASGGVRRGRLQQTRGCDWL